MGKKVFSLCMALVLCLSLLPATALAAAPPVDQVLYVGGVLISNTGYWTTDDKGSVTAYTGESTPTDNYIHYDADNNILTLHNATIKEALKYSDTPPNSLISEAAIGVLNQKDDAELTITLAGTNTIAEVSMGICVLAFSDSTGDASLTIKGTGSLDASGSLNGIMVQSNSGDATLTIQSADVTLTSNRGNGVTVQAGSADNQGHTATLTVNGGKLTASGDAGIEFNAGNLSYNITTGLTVSGNALVDTRNGGIEVYGTGAVNTTADDDATNGGIVFNGDEGTVYGSVTLQEDITIGEGESLTIGDGASLDTNGKTITVESGGKLEGTIDGKQPPEITVSPVNQTMEEGSPAAFSVTASAGEGEQLTYQWQQKTTDSGSEWMDISDATNATYTTGQTTMAMSGYQYRCVVTANGVSVISAPATLTVNAAATTITTQPGNVTVTEGETATFSVTATGSNLTYQWQQSTDGSAWANISGATGISYTTQATTMDMNGYQYRCVVTGNGGSVTSDAATLTVTAATVPVTGVTLNKTSTSLYVGDTETLTPTITPDNATNKNLTWSSDDTSVATVDASGLVTAVSAGTATITVTTEDGAKTANCTVTVSRYSSGGGSSSSSTSLSDRAIDDIQDARPGDTVEITLRPGRTTLEREVFEELAGQDITLEIDAGDGVLWTVNGLDIPEDTRLHDLDLDVDLGDSDIPATVLNAVTGEIDTVQLSLAHDGRFGFTMALSAPLGRENAGCWSNLYWYNERTEELEFQQAARIAEDGTAEFNLDHASDYAIVIDDRSHEPVDLPFNDVPEGYWAYDAIQYVYGEGLMAGTSGSTFNPEGTTTRGQIVTILWRLSGSPVVNYLMDFDDVDPAAYYAEAIRWATSEGIAGGYGGGLFGPDDPITREQLAVMLYRFAQAQGYDVTASADLSGYTDVGEVSSYAAQALSWTAAEGIINGTGATTLSPDGSATRAQVAVILTRFCQEFVEEAN